MGAPTGDHIQLQSMEMEGMLDDELSGFFGRRKLRQGNKMGHFAKSVDKGEIDSVTPPRRSASDEVQRYV